MAWLGSPAPDEMHALLLMRPDIRARVEQLVGQADAEVTATVRAGRRAVAAIAGALRHREVLTGDEVAAIVARCQRRGPGSLVNTAEHNSGFSDRCI